MKSFGFYLVPNHAKKFFKVEADSWQEAIQKASVYAGHDQLFFSVHGTTHEGDCMVHLTRTLRRKASIWPWKDKFKELFTTLLRGFYETSI